LGVRLNAEKGTATKADVKGFYVGGKTGTAEKMINGGHSKNGGAAGRQAALPPADHAGRAAGDRGDPRLRHLGWNAVPVAAKVIERIAPRLGIEPRYDLPPVEKL
jgi:cell division protein FtsI (penicillin-binding protein 3)